MSKRIPKQVALELIAFVKRVEVRANFFDPKGKSAFEFARQMSSPLLQKKNPNYECVMLKQPQEDFTATLKAEFSDGSIFETETSPYTAADLRSLFYEKAEEAEDSIANKSAKK
jgi:hypothetical protein